MMNVLTERQAAELHKAMIGYLSSINASQCAKILREELHLKDCFSDDAVKMYAGLLQRKWTNAARLQRKIMELESRVDDLQSKLSSLSQALARPNCDPHNWLPNTATHTLESHRGAVTCIAFHPVYSALASGSEDCTIKIWDWEFGGLERTLKGHLRSVTGVDFGGPKGKILLASSSNDLTIKIWDPSKNYANIRTISGHDHTISSVRFLRPGANILVSASRDASIRIWDASTGFCTRTIHSPGDWIYSFSPSIDGKWLVSGGRDQAATIWDLTSGEAKSSLLGHDNYIECCVFAPAASYPYLAKLAGLKGPPPPNSSAEFVATGGRDKSIKLWDWRGRLIKTLVGHNNWVQGLVFHPGGKYLLSVSDDQTIRCWDLSENGRLARTIEIPGGFVSCIRWAPSAMGNSEAEQRPGTAAELRCVIGTGSTDSCVRIFT
ncbi:nuclear migration protein nudF [Penicillium canariense]|uniref:Nuclear distribution protein nudF n=1 Tax=Penicillium canariense TaxID=189055 RepID=A0A9W9HZC9_9EURO|nr:nuclear migration protein nudF [Penicillium canariense]KAJ5160386.1 nuclear migration protein nudF [Penicillium canariense]